MNITFRNAQIASLLAVLLITVAVVGIASYFVARYAVSDLGNKIVMIGSRRIDDRITALLQVAESEAEIARLLLAAEVLSVDDHEGLSAYFLEVLKVQPSLSYLSYGRANGEYLHVFRDDRHRLSVLWLRPQRDGRRRVLEFYPETPQAPRSVIRDVADSDRTPPYERPYYLAARAAGETIWTETYVFLGKEDSLELPGVSRAVPVFGSGGELDGVLTADFDLFAVSRSLREFRVGVAGLAFLLEQRRDGSYRLIAHPDAAHPEIAARLPITATGPDGGRITIRGEAVADPRIRSFMTTLPPADLPFPEGLHPVEFQVEGVPHIGYFKLLQGEGRPSWIVGAMVPEAEITGDVQRMARFTLAVAILGVLAVIAGAIIFSRRVSRTLRSMADDARQVARFHLRPRAPLRSAIREIRQLGTAVEEMKSGLRSFQKYVPAELVRRILESGEEARLGGTRREITIYFSDIAGFTSISEALDPEQLVELLAEYLETMTQEMLRAGGTVDKYIGDAIMAFWGAPGEVSGHPAVACRTALANQEALRALRERWSQEGKPAIRARIGLHTGEAVVGNFGSESRLDYTAIGDAVNLASRLENLNRHYGTEILISDATQQRVGEEFLTRPLDRVAVKGRAEGLLIHELIGAKSECGGSDVERVERYTAALELYFDRRWAEARRAFESCAPPDEDLAVALMLERIRGYERTPPPEDWGGVFTMTGK